MQAWRGRATLRPVYGGVLGLRRLRLQALRLCGELRPAHGRLHQQVSGRPLCPSTCTLESFEGLQGFGRSCRALAEQRYICTAFAEVISNCRLQSFVLAGFWRRSSSFCKINNPSKITFLTHYCILQSDRTGRQRIRFESLGIHWFLLKF